MIEKPIVSTGRNIINTDEVDSYVMRLGKNKPDHINQWLASTFRRWLVTGCPAIQRVVDERDMQHPIVQVMLTAFSALAKKMIKLAATPSCGPSKPDFIQSKSTIILNG